MGAWAKAAGPASSAASVGRRTTFLIEDEVGKERLLESNQRSKVLKLPKVWARKTEAAAG
ncbi:hypothetical protein GCM10027175_32430 [Hymenobacter latericoloratus]